MKTIFQISIICLLSIIGTTQVIARPLILEGNWYNEYSNIILKIDSKRKGINVKGIHYRNRNSFFRFYGDFLYADKFGNTISVRNPAIIVYKSRTGSRKLTFRKVYPAGHSGIYDNRRDLPHTYAQDDYGEYGISELSGKRTNDPQTLASLEGTWYADAIKEYVYITETRDGIKARRKDKKDWFSYTLSGTHSDVFNAENGNKYVLEKNGQLRWIKAQGNHQLVLRKISSDFE